MVEFSSGSNTENSNVQLGFGHVLVDSIRYVLRINPGNRTSFSDLPEGDKIFLKANPQWSSEFGLDEVL